MLDGEVEWHPRAEPMRRMEKGEALRWSADGKGTALAANAAGFVGMADMSEKLQRQPRKARHEDWQRFSEKLRRDPRLVAYYQMGTADGGNRRLPNEASGAARRAKARSSPQRGWRIAGARPAARWISARPAAACG